MDSRTRVMTALKGGTPDRVPVVEWSINTRVIEALRCMDLFDLVDQCGLGGVSVRPGREQVLDRPRHLRGRMGRHQAPDGGR